MDEFIGHLRLEQGTTSKYRPIRVESPFILGALQNAPSLRLTLGLGSSAVNCGKYGHPALPAWPAFFQSPAMKRPSGCKIVLRARDHHPGGAGQRNRRADLRPRLIRFLLETGRVTQANLDASSPLITSGLVDSVTLFNLAMWIEEQVGRSVDLTRIALPGDWDSVDLIIGFIERER